MPPLSPQSIYFFSQPRKKKIIFPIGLTTGYYSTHHMSKFPQPNNDNKIIIFVILMCQKYMNGWDETSKGRGWWIRIKPRIFTHYIPFTSTQTKSLYKLSNQNSPCNVTETFFFYFILKKKKLFSDYPFWNSRSEPPKENYLKFRRYIHLV